jgi:hypothetical protein
LVTVRGMDGLRAARPVEIGGTPDLRREAVEMCW